MTIKLPSFPRELVGSDRLSLSLSLLLSRRRRRRETIQLFFATVGPFGKTRMESGEAIPLSSPLLSSPRRVSVYSFGEKKKGSRSIIILDTLDRVRQQAKRPGLS